MLPRNGAGSSKRSVSIRGNNDDLAVPKSPLPAANPGLLLSLSLSARNGIFGCRDRAAKITTRDGENPKRQERVRPVAEIPAKTAYLDSTRKTLVRKDWVVVCAVECEPVSAARFRTGIRGNPLFSSFFSETGN